MQGQPDKECDPITACPKWTGKWNWSTTAMH